MTFMIEGCVELGISCGVSLLMLNSDRWANFSEAFSSLLAIFFTITLVVAPIFVIRAGLKFHGAKQRADRIASAQT